MSTLIRPCKRLRQAGLYGLLLAAVVTPVAGQTILKLDQVPAATPSTDTLFVAGSFNSWNPHSKPYALRKNADGTYQVTLPPGLGAVEYKFTRGSWATVEIDDKNQGIANRKADLASTKEVHHRVLAWDDQSGEAAKPRPHTASPQVHTLAASFNMPQLGRQRRVLVYLPADYNKQPARRYPVLYLHDGQNVFDEATSYGGEWGVDETLDKLRQTGQDATGSIVVAVDNGNEFRSDEYIPWRSTQPELQGQAHQGGQGSQYVDFLVKTLKPYVDAHYRTRLGAAQTGIAGSSLGGLISVYAALKYPKVFGEVGVFSPAFWVCNDSLKAFARKHPAAPTARFYFVCGPKESETMLPLMTQWRDELRAEGVPAGNISFYAPTDGEHREWFWRREFPAAYRFLFQPAAKTNQSGSKR
ncbi:alpha/beta hydrolase [Hymenobacter properus]|uniref:Alpha/beta hydrolase n=1 Tax=Hymenobacter properus TaxID=2791026 RepID=A0A931BB02_9BACT|nr:alpha/beta hydrolase-fold protein [Hymenobacter properus]MBF9140439.1 alpha/beta hydrolase [Hymenobacter properus]MBR7719246.1 alpha/beta hydrolase [Microvirga sp. SRT04]